MVPLSWAETEACVKRSFTSKNWNSKTVSNLIIDDEIKYWKSYGSGIYPSIVINNITYRGQIDPLSVFNAICAGFK